MERRRMSKTFISVFRSPLLLFQIAGVFFSLVSVRLPILQTQALKEYVDTKSRKIGRRPDASGHDNRFSCSSLLLPRALVLSCWGMHGLQTFHIS